MSEKYLNETGLSYFWSKLKAWAVSAFAAIVHSHTGSQVVLTGYSKPASGSAVSASDTASQAIGKLEAKVDAYDDSNYVHKSGDELVAGMKFFTYDSLYVQSLSFEKGVVPQTDDYLAFLFLDKNASFNDVGHPHRLGAVNVHIYPDGGISNSLMVYKNESGSSSNAYLTAGYDANGIAYGRAPSTSTTRTEGTDIVTRNFIPLDTRIVHTTGDETVGGIKEYVPTGGSESSITWAHNVIRNQHLDRTVDDGKVHYTGIVFADASHSWSSANSDGRLCALQSVVNMAEDFSYFSITHREYMKKSGLDVQNAEIRVGIDENGTAFASAPVTRSTGVTNQDIVTYGYLNNDISISGKKLFTASELFMKHTVSKGTIPSNSSYRGIYFLTGDGNLDDKTGHLYRFGRIESCANSSGDVTICMSAYANAANSTASSSLWAIWDSTNSIAAATAPSTSAARTNGSDIVTRDWIPNDSRIVHTTGSETVAGAKTFTSKILNTSGNWKAFDHQKSSLDRDTRPASGSSTAWSGIAALSGSGNKDIVIFCHSVNYTESAAIWSVRKFSSTDTSAGVQVVASNGSSAKTFAPQTNNELSLGDSGRRWTQVYASSSSINTSDERVKRFIDSVPDDVLDAWLDAGFFQFQFADAVSEKGEASARFHIGMVAQRIDAAFKAHGLDASRYGLFCHDEWDAVSEYRNENGELVQPAVSAGDLYSLRYEEVLCLEAACMRRENARLKERLAALEERLAALEMK